MSKTIIERMCSIAEKMHEEGPANGGMPIANMHKAAADIKALSKRLEMTGIQVVILTAVVQKSANYNVNGEILADELGVTYLKFLTYHEEMEGLRRRGYIRIDGNGAVVIPRDVLNGLKKNEPVTPAAVTGLGPEELLYRIKETLASFGDDEYSNAEFEKELGQLMDLNPDNSVSRAIRRMRCLMTNAELVVLYGLIYRYHFEDDDMVGWHDMRDYFDERILNSLMCKYKAGTLTLQKKGIIEPTGRDGLLGKDYFHLTTPVKQEIFADTGGVREEEPEIHASRTQKALDIHAKALYYNQPEGPQVARLEELLSEKRFNDIREKMKAKGLRTGFTCLFYGSPGTGKTETVYQIARKSGRDLFIVDVARIKSKWVGESEKNLKEVFDQYRQAVQAGGNTPILLFNEADAILGIRQEGAERAVEKMENSLQNIILQEMEDLDGILIATTNLTTNLDKAFERRFLYKIRFDKPLPEARANIWRAMLPELTEPEALRLATEFNFSGGQIENVTRKREIQSIIGLEEPGFADILSYCREELLDPGAGHRRIGF